MIQVQQLRPVQRGEKQIPPKLHPALGLLLEAYDYARDVKCDVWDFAIEIETLEAAGLTPNDFRWLVSKGYVQAGCEKTTSCGQGRELSLCSGLSFNERTCRKRACFVLTQAGLAFARECSTSEARSDASADSNHDAHASPAHPHWDGELRELHAGGHVVKRYRCRAANQETILSAFEEEGWPRHVDDPLSPIEQAQDPKRRLNDTVKGLNRHQVAPLIRFAADGTGEGVRWEWVDDRVPPGGA